MRARVTAAAVLMILVGSLAACGKDEASGAFPDDCRLPSPKPGVDAAAVPTAFIPPEAEVRDVQHLEGLEVYALNAPVSVEEGFTFYKDALADRRYRLISEDNEGFEAEIYYRDRRSKQFVAIQMRNAGCEGAIGIFVTIGQPQVPLEASPSPAS